MFNSFSGMPRGGFGSVMFLLMAALVVVPFWRIFAKASRRRREIAWHNRGDALEHARAVGAPERASRQPPGSFEIVAR